jgi:eukaryotic-like serine/threonine-protein kinase
LLFTPGTRLGSYEIVSAIGAGGMGEVYRARDTRLDRDVALKVLPEAFASDTERVARFEREAKTLASINHPHIAQIYGVEDRALIMELVEGEDLAQRIVHGPLGLEEALAIARQIAAALEAAHAHGIVHRDLKPANIKVRPDGTVKVLDFGLAKVIEPATAVRSRGDHDLRNSPTITSPAQTMRGVILGTAAYMSPEQARGQAVDERSDIWSFGCVLFELLCGRAPFAADTVTDVLAAVVTREPDWNVLPPTTPPAVVKLLKRCLQRDPKRRLHHAADMRIELDDPELLNSIPVVTPRKAAWRLTAMVALGAAAAATAVTWLALRASTEGVPQPARRFALSELNSLVIDTYQSLALSADGQMLAYRGRGSDGVMRLFVRQLDAIQPSAISGTDGAQLPFFSADGQWLGFFAGGELRKIALGGGPPQTIARSLSRILGATWMDDGTVVFVGDEGLQRVPATGGQVETLLGKSGGRWFELVNPVALPGSVGVLGLVRRVSRWELAVFSMRDKTLTTLLDDAGAAAWMPTGHILVQQRNSILALPFDLSRLSVTGPSVAVLSDVGTQVSLQSRMFAVAGDGTLVYIPAAPAGRGEASLLWVDRTGQEKVITALERVSDLPRLSPDGTKVAVRAPGPNCDVWVHDLERGTTTRLTRGDSDHHGVVWSNDGRWIVTARLAENGADIIALPSDGSGPPKVLGQSPSDTAVPSSWSSAAQALLTFERRQHTSVDVVAYPTTGGNASVVLDSPASESSASFSPDGRHIAYVSDESGRSEIYVRPYRGEGARIQISTAGGVEPVWARDGTGLYFRNGREVLMANTKTMPTFSASRPVVLFSSEWSPGSMQVPSFDVAPDGQRFVIARGRQWIEGQVVMILNWPAEWPRLGSGVSTATPQR